MKFYDSSRLFDRIKDADAERQTLELLTRLYEQRRSRHYGMRSRPREVFAADVDWFRRQVPAPASVLECGAGTGVFASMLAERGYRVTAADCYGRDDLDTLRHRYRDQPALELVHVDDVLASDQRFDAVISVSVLEHVVRPDEALLAWRDHLEPGGILSIVCPNYSGVLSPLRIAFGGLTGGSLWRYRSVVAALRHAAENFALEVSLRRSGRPCFVRCTPEKCSDEILMTDSDIDTVHLPSARGLRNFLEAHGFHVLNWGAGTGRSPVARMIDRFAPGWSPTVRIHATRTD